MTDDLMTIREMCETFDVTPRTLRFYESKELLNPIRQGQRRLYTRVERGRLKLILRGKRFGFSLEDIRQLLDLYNMGDQQETQIRTTYDLGLQRLAEMETQKNELEETIADLKKQLAFGDELLASFERKRGGG